MKESQIELSACPSCNSMRFREIIKGGDRLTDKDGIFSIVECLNCRLWYLTPRLAQKELLKYYPDNYPAYQRTLQEAKRYGLNLRIFLLKSYYCLRRFPFLKLSGGIPLIVSAYTGKLILSMVELKRDSYILDIGCATGFFLDHVRWLTGAKIAGIEHSEYARSAARQVLGVDAGLFGSLEETPFEKDSFDLVTLWFVLSTSPSLQPL